MSRGCGRRRRRWGCPVCWVRQADPASGKGISTVHYKVAACAHVNAGDRGIIDAASIDALNPRTELNWLTSLRAPAIATLAADDGPLQKTLFDQQNLAETTHPDYPG